MDATSEEDKQIVWEVRSVGGTRKTRKQIIGHKKAKFDSIPERK